jgi:hypothetical protein
MRQISLVLAIATMGVLAAMVAVMIATGASQEAHEFYRPHAEYAAALLERPGATRLLFGLDVAFLVLYTAFFAAFADYLHGLGRPFTRLALAALVGTAVLDIIEDHNILTMLGIAERGEPLSDATIALQQVISSTKFTVSYLALFLFGLAIPRGTRLGVVLAVFLTAGTLVGGVIAYGAPTSWRESIDASRGLGFLVGFALAIAWLRAQPRESSASATT